MKIRNIRLTKLIMMLLALLLCISAVSCGGPSDTETQDGETETEEPPRFDGPTLSVGDSVTMGAYYDESDAATAPLTWTVIKAEKHRALIIADKCIDYVPFETTAYKSGSTVNWENSSIRSWLNGDFYSQTFSDAEKASILNGGAEDTVAISTAANGMTDLGACADTYDKVFLLSADEAEALFAKNGDRKAAATAYAETKGARVKEGNAAWWLRTMGEDNNRAAVVLHDGTISYAGYHVNFGSAAVRPCMWIATNTDYKQENPVVSLAKAKAGSRVVFGSYEQDGDTANGAEQLVWQVAAVEGDKLLLITENVIDMQKFATAKGVWESSALREWLGGTFLNAAFSAEEQAKIAETAVTVGKNPETGVSGGNSTADRVFVLSIEELLTYFPEQADRRAEATAYAVANGVSVDLNYGTAGYWTRDAGDSNQYAAYVYYYGDVNYNGVRARTDYIGVRPAIWVTK